jgi:hypothetical protein
MPTFTTTKPAFASWLITPSSLSSMRPVPHLKDAYLSY